MEFARPAWLWTLLTIPLLVLLAGRAIRLRRQGWKRLGKSSVLPVDGDWRWICTLSLLVIAAVGPRWDWKARSSAAKGHDVMLVIDTSRSMGVADALPTRMGTAVESATSLIRAIGAEEGGRVGLVAFAGRGVVLCPLTENLGVVTDTVKALRPGDVRPGGTNLAAGVNVALDAFATSDPTVPRTIVLFTDGEDLTGSWPTMVARLRQEKVTLHGVAIGDVEMGHPVPTRGGKSLQFQGRIVESRRNDTPIETLAAATGGTVVRLGLAPADLKALFERRIKPFVAQRRHALQWQLEMADRHVPFVLAAIVVGVSACRTGRFRGGRTVWLLLLIAPGASPGDASNAELIRQGNAAYDRADLETARKLFETALRNDPRSDVAVYDAGAAAFQLGRFDDALRDYERANALTKNDGLRMKIQFALGNVHVALDNRSEAIRAYNACLASTVAGPQYDAIRRDAAINKRFAERERPKAEKPNPPGETKGQGAKPTPDNPSGTPGENSNTPPSQDGASDADNSGTSGSDTTTGAEESSDPRTLKQRFQAALDNARQARDFRQSDDGPRPTQDEVLKDW